MFDLIGSIHKFIFALNKGADRLLHAHGRQSLSSIILLKILHAHGSLSQDAIAEFLVITPPAVSRQISSLEKAGLVTREKVKGNRREYRIKLTAAGKKEVESSFKLLERSLEPICDHISEPKRHEAMQTIESMLEFIQGDTCPKAAKAPISKKK